MRQFEEVSSALKYWWMLIVLGIIQVVLGIWVAFEPVASYLALSYLFGIALLLYGLMEATFAIINRNRFSSWGWYLATGLLTLIIGALILLFPGLTALTFAILVGIWLGMYGIRAITLSLDLRKYQRKNWGLLLVLGIILLVLTFIIIGNPFFGGISIVVLTSIALLTAGIGNIRLALELREEHQQLRNDSSPYL
jgi:uncharacterized membrane protein HdeD (DUF308 family)